MSEERKDLHEVLGTGFAIGPLPEGWTPLEGIVLVKCLDADGEPSWAFRTTSGLNDEELLGALTIRLELLKEETLDMYRNSDRD